MSAMFNPTLVRIALIPLVPLVAITASYFCLVDIPFRNRVFAGMSSMLLAVMIPAAIVVSVIADRRSEMRSVLEAIVIWIVPLVALCFMVYTLFRVRTWMNVLQIPTLLFGCIAWYFMALGPLG